MKEMAWIMGARHSEVRSRAIGRFVKVQDGESLMTQNKRRTTDSRA